MFSLADLFFLTATHVTTVTLVLSVLLALIVYYTKETIPGIPGPKWRLPLIGHFHLLSSRPHLSLTSLQQRYGDVYSLQLGPHPTIVICGRELIKQACANRKLMGRPHKYFNSWQKHARYFAFGHSGTCLLYRKIVIRALAEFTRGGDFHDVVVNEAQSLVQTLCSKESNSRAGHQNLVCHAVSNLAYHLCYGRVAKQTDAEFDRLSNCVSDILQFAKHASLADSFPWATWIPSIRNSYARFEGAQDDLISIVKDQEVRHNLISRSEADDNSNSLYEGKPDLCDVLHASCPKRQQRGLAEDKCIGTTVEQTGMLLVAGTETVATSLNWAILLLAVHQDVQEKLHANLKTQSNHSLDRPSLPSCDYLEAFILETLRFSMASPLAMPHMTLEHMELRGHVIPKDTIVLINLWSGSRDRRTWGDDAEKFRPERFIDDKGQVKKALADEIQAFGSGRRRCAGEEFAKRELNIFLEKFVLNCHVGLEDPTSSVDFWSHKAIRNRPPDVPLSFTARTSGA